MSSPKQSWGYEHAGTVVAGVNWSLDADRIQSGQMHWCKNASLTNGKFKTRPPFTERLTLPQGHVQGIAYFDSDSGKLVTMIDGELYQIEISGDSFEYDLVDTGLKGSPFARQAWFQQTTIYMVIQNGVDTPIIYDGTSARRAEPNEIGVGRAMAYGNGRLWYARGENQYGAGDIADRPGDELKFTEINFFVGGGWITAPGRITGMAFMPSNDGTTGYGELVVGGRRWMDAVRADIRQRDLWQSAQGFVRSLYRHIGFLSDDSIAEVNQDLYFRDGNGDIRSIRQAVSDVNTPGQTPISNESLKLFGYESASIMYGGSMMYFDNRLLISASPYMNKYGRTTYRDLASLNFVRIGTMRGKAPPEWEGEWEGLPVLKTVKGEFNGQERAFALCLHPDGTNRLWEIHPEKSYHYADRYLDQSGNLQNSPIKSYYETHKLQFGDGSKKKRLELMEVFYSDVRGPVTVSVYFRADNDHEWRLWDTFEDCANMQHSVGDTDFKTIRPKSKSGKKTMTCPDYFDGNVTGYEFQIRVVVSGRCQIDRAIAYAEPLQQESFGLEEESICDKLESERQPEEYETTYTPASYDTLVDHSGNTYVNHNGDTYTVLSG